MRGFKVHPFHRPDLEAADTYRNEKAQEDDFSRLLAIPNPLVVDVGANRGQWSARLIEIVPGAEVHCFEPAPEAYRDLQEWASEASNVFTNNSAISTRGGALSSTSWRETKAPAF